MDMAVVKKCVALATYLAYDLFLNDDDEDDDEMEEPARPKLKIIKIAEYSERIVPSMNDKTFQSHFRLSRPTFSLLIQRLACTIVHHAGDKGLYYLLFINFPYFVHCMNENLSGLN